MLLENLQDSGFDLQNYGILGNFRAQISENVEYEFKQKK